MKRLVKIIFQPFKVFINYLLTIAGIGFNLLAEILLKKACIRTSSGLPAGGFGENIYLDRRTAKGLRHTKLL